MNQDSFSIRESASTKPSAAYIKQLLDRYFSGKSVFPADIDAKEKEFYEFYLVFWLAFYTLIQTHWTVINSYLNSKGFSFEELGLRTPGEALIAAVEDDCVTGDDTATKLWIVCYQTCQKIVKQKPRKSCPVRKHLKEFDSAKKRLMSFLT